MHRSLRGQAGRFLAVGACTVAVDFLVYRLLLALDAPVLPSKTVSFVAATVLAYVLNRLWTFRAPGGPGTAVAFAMLYGCSLLVNVGVNSVVLGLIAGVRLDVEVAFVAAQAVSTTINFLAMRYLVFSRPRRTSR